MVDIRAATLVELPIVQDLAHRIWHRHYPGIISVEQIGYMLERGYAMPVLGECLVAPGAGLALARDGERPVGFAAWSRSAEPATTRLDKLYVLQEDHRRGIGRRLIEHVETAARADGSTALILNVNKRNLSSVVAYEHCGFTTRESLVVEIGNGFVMDDYVMAKML